ncbi:hypothetical protein [Duffyella gerundensis]|uniref:hypothetical protein n=1 Tax=Duffyella gerundensis TaxID=1619313 RepID=UPI001653FAD9|nr:hypothetical protein [Duffyella gerundensis]
MGSMKEHMMDLEMARFETWAAEHYPDVQPDTEEWEQIGLYYYWEQEALAEQAEREHEQDIFAASLDNVQERYRHAKQELRKLHALLDSSQPELVYRMSLVHAVTVMEAYLMYCARALLEHEWPLRRFRDAYYLQSGRINNRAKQAAGGMDISMLRPAARSYVSRLTFHNIKTIEHYFGTVLHVSPCWPLGPLSIITQWRNDLVHRNGVAENDVPVDISPLQLQNALQKVHDLIEAADISMRQEVDWFGDWRTVENREIITAALLPFPGDFSQ